MCGVSYEHILMVAWVALHHRVAFSEETKNIQTHRAVFNRKSEVSTYMIRVWLNPEDVPSRNNFFALRSQELLRLFAKAMIILLHWQDQNIAIMVCTEWRI
jgi:hypothetical protein